MATEYLTTLEEPSSVLLNAGKITGQEYKKKDIDKRRKVVRNMASYCGYRDIMPYDYDKEPEERRANKMDRIRMIAKKLLDKDTRTFIKAGILDDDLNLTATGAEAVVSDYFLKNKSRMLKIANDMIEEKEKES